MGHTEKVNGERVRNGCVVSEINSLLGQEFVSYGYLKEIHYLREDGYVINKKKVYRLMKKAGLLLQRRGSIKGKREFLKECVVRPLRPHEYFEMDIKFWLSGEKRNAYLLSVMDVYSRKVVDWKFGKSIRKRHMVRLLMKSFSLLPEVKGIRIRTGNGSQFIAHTVRDYLKEMGLTHEFTDVSTPQENGRIEGFHIISETEVTLRFEYGTLEDPEAILRRYMLFYNKKRLHSSIGYQSPDQFL